MRNFISRAVLCLVAVATVSGCGTRQYLKYVEAVMNGHKVEADAAVDDLGDAIDVELVRHAQRLAPRISRKPGRPISRNRAAA